MVRFFRHSAVMLLIFSIFVLTPFSSVFAKGFPQAVFILDASGSMWGDAGGQTKIEAAKAVLSKTVLDLPAQVKTGLAAYGHRRKGDCGDIEILVPAGHGGRNEILKQVSGISPKGKTPIAASVQLVADGLKSVEDETIIILISDGEETCHPHPCGVVKSLKQSGARFVLHVVGFDVDNNQKLQLECLAKAGEGRYFTANDTASLTAAMTSVQAEVVQKVEKAKAVSRKSTTRLGKLRITMPEPARVSLNTIIIIRDTDKKEIKKIEDPSADTTHPLMAGTYRIVAGYANSNYKPDSEVHFGVYKVAGGETTEINLGALAVNIADALDKIPAGAVMVMREDENPFTVVTPYTGNDYYFYKTKPLPAGTYSFAVHYKRSYLYRTNEIPVVLAKGIKIESGKESVVTIDSGIQIKKPQDSAITSWKLVPTASETAVLHVKRASNGDYPLWAPYAVAPGTYDVYVMLEGMSEPLMAGEAINIGNGELLEFDMGF